MKGFSIVVIIVIAFVLYKFFNHPAVVASGNTAPDDKKNINIANPQLNSGQIVQTDGTNELNFQNGLNPNFEKNIFNSSDINLTNGKGLMTSDNSISAVANIRQDSVTPLGVVSDIGQVPIKVDGSRYGSNLPDPSLILQVPPTRIQNFVPLDLNARVNDNILVQPMSLGFFDRADVNIPAIA